MYYDDEERLINPDLFHVFRRELCMYLFAFFFFVLKSFGHEWIVVLWVPGLLSDAQAASGQYVKFEIVVITLFRKLTIALSPAGYLCNGRYSKYSTFKTDFVYQ